MNRYKPNKAIDLSIIHKNERERERHAHLMFENIQSFNQIIDRKFDKKKYFG